jgi:hypothetical protein
VSAAPRPFLVAGHPRSGTTILTRLLDSHPEIEATFELGAFQGLDTAYSEYRRGLRLGYRDWPVRKFGTGTPRSRTWASRRFLAEFRYRLWRRRHGRIGLETVTEALSRTLGGERVGDKLPSYVFQLDDLARREGLDRIVIVRDCRAVTASTLMRVQTGWSGRPWTRQIDTPAKVAANWVRAIESMERNMTRVHVVRFEDLVEDPASCAKGLGEALGVEPVAFDVRLVRRPAGDKVDRFLGESDLEDIEAVAGSAMRRWGYSPAGSAG